MTNPLPEPLTDYRLNRTLHGRSVYRKRDVRGHNVIHFYNTPGVSDALDVFCPAGIPVRAPHDGKITRIAQPRGRLGCVYIVTAKHFTVLAHLHVREALKVGDVISEGLIIGWIGRVLSDPHLHWEMQMDGKVISAPTAKRLAARMQAVLDGH